MNPIKHLLIIFLIGLAGCSLFWMGLRSDNWSTLVRTSTQSNPHENTGIDSTATDKTETNPSETGDPRHEPAASTDTPEGSSDHNGEDSATFKANEPEEDVSNAEPDSPQKIYNQITRMAQDRNDKAPSPAPNPADNDDPRDPALARQTSEIYQNISKKLRQRHQ